MEETRAIHLPGLEQTLLEAGISRSSQILMIPEDVLCIAGAIPQWQSRILRNVARQMIAPLLGLQGIYDDPEIPSEILNSINPQLLGAPITCEEEEEVSGGEESEHDSAEEGSDGDNDEWNDVA